MDPGTHYLNCKGLRSPLPIIQIAKALSQLPLGATLHVEADDDRFEREVQGWAIVHQEKLLSFRRDLKTQHALLERASLI